jgi:hypothetical protein
VPQILWNPVFDVGLPAQRRASWRVDHLASDPEEAVRCKPQGVSWGAREATIPRKTFPTSQPLRRNKHSCPPYLRSIHLVICA